MNIYTYSVIDSNEPLTGHIRGLRHSMVYNIGFGDIGAVVSDLGEQIESTKEDDVLRHEEVVERLMSDFTVLPVRFLTVFETEEAVLSLMKCRYNNFKSNLGRLRDKVEFGIKVIWPGETLRSRIANGFDNSRFPLLQSHGSPVRSFLREKFEKHKVEEEVTAEAARLIMTIDGHFSGIASEKRLVKLQTQNLLLNAAYLVEKERQEEFKQAFERLRETIQELKFLFSGPWPPYSFITLSTGSDHPGNLGVGSASREEFAQPRSLHSCGEPLQ